MDILSQSTVALVLSLASPVILLCLNKIIERRSAEEIERIKNTLQYDLEKYKNELQQESKLEAVRFEAQVTAIAGKKSDAIYALYKLVIDALEAHETLAKRVPKEDAMVLHERQERAAKSMIALQSFYVQNRLYLRPVDCELLNNVIGAFSGIAFLCTDDFMDIDRDFGEAAQKSMKLLPLVLEFEESLRLSLGNF